MRGDSGRAQRWQAAPAQRPQPRVIHMVWCGVCAAQRVCTTGGAGAAVVWAQVWADGLYQRTEARSAGVSAAGEVAGSLAHVRRGGVLQVIIIIPTAAACRSWPSGSVSCSARKCRSIPSQECARGQSNLSVMQPARMQAGDPKWLLPAVGSGKGGFGGIACMYTSHVLMRIAAARFCSFPPPARPSHRHGLLLHGGGLGSVRRCQPAP